MLGFFQVRNESASGLWLLNGEVVELSIARADRRWD
jgi:hypothetical protein